MQDADSFEDIDSIIIGGTKWYLCRKMCCGIKFSFHYRTAVNARITAKRRVLSNGDGVAAGFGVFIS